MNLLPLLGLRAWQASEARLSEVLVGLLRDSEELLPKVKDNFHQDVAGRTVRRLLLGGQSCYIMEQGRESDWKQCRGNRIEDSVPCVGGGGGKDGEKEA